MHIAQGFVKGRNVVSTLARNTSCNSGWLRLVVQIIFGTLIVSSFILIMLMVVGKPRSSRSSSRCTISNCHITCENAPYYGEYEEDIINAASEADNDLQCKSIVLKLIGPTFKNFQIPPSWLWSMSSNVRILSIVGGNIKQIAPDAFMSPFGGNIKALILEEIEIKVWEKDMLVGLSNLQKLLIRDCILSDIRKDALAPVDDSLIFLDIKASNTWNPINVTGTTKLFELSVVDFSSNIFPKILGNASFFKLRSCKVLFLNSCHIEFLEPGTFDYLENIEILHLNDNHIVTIPIGLFDRILPRKPRIALQNNPWHCDCSSEDLRNVVRKELLVVDPICHSPDAIYGITFSDFEEYCKINYDIGTKNSDHRGIVKHEYNANTNDTSEIIYINGACHGNISSKISHLDETLRVIAISEHQSCLLNRINRRDLIKSFSYANDNGLISITDDQWIKPVFFVQNNPYSMVEIISSAVPGYGLLWYQSSCEDIVYCVNTVPRLLKVFNINISDYFTICPFNLSSGTVRSSHCVSYNLRNIITNSYFRIKSHELILFICLCFGCLMCGAICVYGMIQKNPTLLKGSKRVLFVKHKSVEALILPPKLPLRKNNNVANTTSRITTEKGNNIFVLPHKENTLNNFSRSFSMKSNGTNDVSYISALLPTDEQLIEWRSNQIAKQFDSIPSSNFSVIPHASIYDRESLPYYSFNNDERVYEVPMQP